MVKCRSFLLTMSIALPAIALGIFAFAPPLRAECEPGPAVCCHGATYQSFALGTCYDDCWFPFDRIKCLEGEGYAYFSNCGSC